MENRDVIKAPLFYFNRLQGRLNQSLPFRIRIHPYGLRQWRAPCGSFFRDPEDDG